MNAVWLTVPEVAKRLRLSRPFAYALVADGRLPAYRIGRALRVKASDVDALAEPVTPKAPRSAAG